MKKRKMSEKVASDLEKMNKDRRKAEEEYLASKDRKLNVQKIMKEGILSSEDLMNYLDMVVEEVKLSEDMGRLHNNPIVYSEAIGIKREFEKLLNLLYVGAEKLQGGEATESVDGTEEKHRESNDGGEAYA